MSLASVHYLHIIETVRGMQWKLATRKFCDMRFASC